MCIINFEYQLTFSLDEIEFLVDALSFYKVNAPSGVSAIAPAGDLIHKLNDSLFGEVMHNASRD